MERIELPQLHPCEGCGKCCDYIGLPPFEVANPDLGPVPRVRGEAWLYPDDCHYHIGQLVVGRNHEGPSSALFDLDVFAGMPAGLRAEHAATVQGLTADPTGKPCAWLDVETKQCRHYDHRPYTCRTWDVGSRGCMGARGGTKVQWRDKPNMLPAFWRNPLMPKANLSRADRKAWVALLPAGTGTLINPPWHRRLRSWVRGRLMRARWWLADRWYGPPGDDGYPD